MILTTTTSRVKQPLEGLNKNKLINTNNMKKIYILLIAICLGNVVNAQDWQWLNPLPQGHDLTHFALNLL